MTVPTDDPRAFPFQIEIPDGWTGLENPRAGVLLELELEEPVGYASRMMFEVVDELPQGLDEAGPMEVLIASRASGLAQLMTDGLVLDLAMHGDRPADGELLAYRATVVFRHGPHLVTAFLWTIPLDVGALVITGLTDADVIELDAGAFAVVIESLRTGDRVRPVASDDLPPLLPEPTPPRERPELPQAPAGWTDGLPSDDRVLRMLVATDPVAVPASIFAMAALEHPGDAEERHAAVLDDLAQTMTDAEVQQAGLVDLAIGEAWRSLIVFRQGDEAYTADVWTGNHDATLPIVWTLCAFDDAECREGAAAWVSSATLEDLGVL